MNILTNFVSTGLLCLLMWLPAMSQQNYEAGKLMVKFKEGFIPKEFARGEQAKATHSEMVLMKANTRKQDPSSGYHAWENKLMRRLGEAPVFTYEKVFPDFKPSYTYSKARNSRLVPMPKLHNVLYLEVPEETNIPKFCLELLGFEGIEGAMPLYYGDIFDVTTVNDSLYGLQLSLENPEDEDIDAERAWALNTGSYQIKVGVIDSGIDYSHPDLGGGIGSGMKIAGGYNVLLNNQDITDNNSHGTAVTGIIGALRNNEIGVAGIAGGDGEGNIGAQIYGLAPFRGIQDAYTGVMRAAAEHPEFGFGVHITNCSWGFLERFYNHNEEGRTLLAMLEEAFRFAARNGVVQVVAKGNTDGTEVIYPADYSDELVITVGASDSRGQRKSPAFLAGSLNEWGSSYGSSLDVMAPGSEDLLFTTNLYDDIPDLAERGIEPYRTFGGTSGAAPHVTGVASLLLAKNPSLHPDDVQNLIEIGAEDIIRDDLTGRQDLIGYDIYSGHGRLNAGNTLELLEEPYQLTHQIARGIDRGEEEGFVDISLAEGATGRILPPGKYRGRRYGVYKTVSVPKNLKSGWKAWARSIGASTGWSSDKLNFQDGFAEVVAQTENTITLKSYVYVLFDDSNSYGWYPSTPNQVEFHYSLLGIENEETPLSVEITGNTVLKAGELGEWSANAQGGNGTYDYEWFISSAQNFNLERIPNSNSPVLSRRMQNEDKFLRLQVEVSSGSQTKTDDIFVSCPDCKQDFPLCVECPEPIILPNPVQGTLNIKLDIKVKDGSPNPLRTFALYDPYGNLVKSKQTKEIELQMDVSALRFGLYKLMITEPRGIVQKGILIKS